MCSSPRIHSNRPEYGWKIDLDSWPIHSQSELDIRFEINSYFFFKSVDLDTVEKWFRFLTKQCSFHLNFNPPKVNMSRSLPIGLLALTWQDRSRTSENSVKDYFVTGSWSDIFNIWINIIIIIMLRAKTLQVAEKKDNRA